MSHEAYEHSISLLEPPFSDVKKEKVLIVDDDEGIRLTLEAILKEDYTVLTARSGEEALKKIHHDIPVVLLDIRLPGISGIETLERIVEDYPDIQIIMVSAVHGAETIVECIRKGAYDYMTKELDYDPVRLRVRNALAQAELKRIYDQQSRKLRFLEAQLKLNGHEHSTRCYRNCEKRFIPSPDEEAADQERLEGPPQLSRFLLRCMEGEDLTIQEQKVLALVLQGFSNKEISGVLKIGPSTVKTHLKNAFQKLGVQSRSQAVAYLLPKGLKEFSPPPKG